LNEKETAERDARYAFRSPFLAVDLAVLPAASTALAAGEAATAAAAGLAAPRSRSSNSL
jgi:hypothetical protein